MTQSFDQCVPIRPICSAVGVEALVISHLKTITICSDFLVNK